MEKRRKRGGCGPFEINVTPSTNIQLRRKRGVDVLSLRVSVRVDRIHSHSGGVVCYVSNGTEKNIRLQFNLVYSSGFTGPLYFDVTESPSRHCQ